MDSSNKVLESDNVVFFDIDDTLVIWDVPIGKENETVLFNNYGYDVRLLPHKRHIELLLQFKARGHKVIIWSQGGYEWAREVIKMLGLEKDVDLIMSKPKWYVDDLPSEAFMGKPTYFPLDKPLPKWDHDE